MRLSIPDRRLYSTKPSRRRSQQRFDAFGNSCPQTIFRFDLSASLDWHHLASYFVFPVICVFAQRYVNCKSSVHQPPSLCAPVMVVRNDRVLFTFIIGQTRLIYDLVAVFSN